MSQITITEDCSPYFFKIKHSKILNVLDIINESFTFSYIKNKMVIIGLPEQLNQRVNDCLPYKKEFKLLPKKMALFVSGAGFYGRAHKDERSISTALNYTIFNSDNLCTTSWYDDNDLLKYQIRELNNGKIRDVENFEKSKHKPIAKTISRMDEITVVNQEVYHDIDNSLSTNIRVILHVKFSNIALTFDEHKKILLDS